MKKLGATTFLTGFLVEEHQENIDITRKIGQRVIDA
jgi:hypothetical protein